jgi:hypothetical protein
MCNFIISENDLKNLLIFLDRVQYNGLKEVDAINRIIRILQNPIDENKQNELKKK